MAREMQVPSSVMRGETDPHPENLPASRRPWRDVWHGFGRALGLLTLVALASLVGATGFALHDRARWTTVAYSMVLWSLPAASVLTGVGFIVQLVGLQLGSRVSAATRTLFSVLVGVTWVSQMMLGVAAAQFLIERGTSMTFADLAQGSDLGFIASQLSILTGPLYGPALGGSLLASLLITAWRWRRNPGSAANRSAHAWARGLAGALVALSVWYGVGRVVGATERGGLAMRPFQQLSTFSYAGFATLLARAPTDDLSVRSGAELIGLPARGGCPPLSVPLEEAATEGPGGALDAHARAYGRALFAERRGPFSVWVVALESVGAEDVAALEPRVPRQLTPYLDRLHSRQDGWFASRDTRQAGVRTAQALSAVMCGLGSAPHRLAVLRDLPNLPLRCLSDVLVAAGARARYFYGSDPQFDRTGASLREHGFSEILVPDGPGLPKGTWGVSDRALFDFALEHVGRDAHESTLQVLFTLSTHSPFRRAEDHPAEVEARVGAAIAELPVDAAKKDHLSVVAYADHALGHFLPELLAREQARGRLPLVMVLGDHASGLGLSESPVQQTRIPFALWVPPCDSPSCARARGELGASFETTPLSQNDLPRLVLALLDGAPRLRALPRSERWHTIGGQTLSPHFRADTSGPGARWTNARASAWLIDGEGREVRHATIESLERARQVEKDTSFCAPGASVLAWAANRAEACVR